MAKEARIEMTTPLTRDELKSVVREAISESFVSVGMDPDEKLSLQKDMAFIRSARLSRERITGKLILSALTVFVTTAIGFMIAGFLNHTP